MSSGVQRPILYFQHNQTFRKLHDWQQVYGSFMNELASEIDRSRRLVAGRGNDILCFEDRKTVDNNFMYTVQKR